MMQCYLDIMACIIFSAESLTKYQMHIGDSSQSALVCFTGLTLPMLQVEQTNLC
jgi:hypothetical protein